MRFGNVNKLQFLSEFGEIWGVVASDESDVSRQPRHAA